MLLSVAGRAKDKEGAATLIVTKMGGADNAAKGAMLSALDALVSAPTVDVMTVASSSALLSESGIHGATPRRRTAIAPLAAPSGNARRSGRRATPRGPVGYRPATPPASLVATTAPSSVGPIATLTRGARLSSPSAKSQPSVKRNGVA